MRLRNLSPLVISFLFSINLFAQTQCYQRTIEDVVENIHYNTIRIDSICNDKVMWSEIHDYFGYEIHHNNYDKHGRITSKSAINYLNKVHCFRPQEDFPQYNQYHSGDYTVTRIDTIVFNYLPDESNLKASNSYSKLIESIIFEIITDQIQHMETYRVDLYYKYIEGELVISKEEFSLNDNFIKKNTSKRFSANASRSKEDTNQTKKFPDENIFVATLVDDNNLIIQSNKYPIKPSFNAGTFNNKGLRCKVKLNDDDKVIEVDKFWLGKKFYDYKIDKLISIQSTRNDKLYENKTVRVE